MKAIKLTRGFVALVDDEDYEKLSAIRWQVLVIRRPQKTTYYAKKTHKKGESCLMHRLILGAKQGILDHINGNGLDNRKANLRIATGAQNQQNRVKQKSVCTSQYKGVSWHAGGKKWQAHIKTSDANRYLGLFTSEVEAAIAYNAAAIEKFGTFAHLNIVDDPKVKKIC